MKDNFTRDMDRIEKRARFAASRMAATELGHLEGFIHAYEMTRKLVNDFEKCVVRLAESIAFDARNEE